MRGDISCLALLVLSIFPSSSSGLPLSRLEKSQPEEALLPRASYSVVPVDGGASPTGGAGPAGHQAATVTIIQTTTQTAPAPPQATVTVFQIQSISAATVTIMSISTLPANEEVHTIMVTATTTTLVSSATSSSIPSVSVSTSADTSSSSSPLITQAAVFTKTYDNGLWHTTYPAWSNSTATASSLTHSTTLV